ncbi:MAG: AraC family transcriptional regulator [Hespellia sp.]|nr:AraC family transcriptional regulator [Hespellia sp.]
MEKGNYEIIRFLDWEIVKLIPHVDKYATGKKTVFRHWHTGIEILYFVGGNSEVWINGKTIHIQEEGIVLVNSNEPHQIICYETKQAKGCTIIISYEYLKTLYKKVDQCYFVLDEQHPSFEKLKWYMKGLLSVYQRRSRNEFYHIKLNNIANEIIYLLLKDFRNENEGMKTQRYAERYRLIIQFIEDHYRENIKMQQLADKFHFSKEYFSRSFKKYMGINFKDYLTKRRLLEAEKILLMTDKQISEIALESGFTDIKVFYAAFKKEYKSTPNEYRKKKSIK